MDLDNTRKRIDGIDGEIMKLLSKRMELALQTRRFKKDVEDKERESQVLDHVRKSSGPLVKPEFAGRIYGEIIKESKDLQKEKLTLVGFQGEHGAYSEMAAKAYDKDAIPIPCKEFDEVFEGVRKGLLDRGIVPVENTLAGAVIAVNDLLVETELHVVGEVKVPIHHCLLVLPDTDHREIKVAYSHPMALAQCRGFLGRHKLEGRNFYDTAGAAKMLSEERPRASAAIASRLAAETYGLEVLRENIEDHPSNTTRFFVLSKEPSKEKGDKCSIIFSTPHKAGALFNVLKEFSEAKINLTRIESRPIRDDPGNFAFLVDFQGSEDEPRISKALAKVQEHTDIYKFLGCYKEAKG